MTISLVNHTHGVTNNGGSSWTVTTPGATAGNLLICATSSDTVTTGVSNAGLPTDNKGGTWTAQTDACSFSDLRVDAKIALGGEHTVTCSQSPSSGGASILYEMSSSVGPFTLGSIYATAITTNVQSAHTNDAAVVVAANADWLVAFAGCDFSAIFTASSPFQTMESLAVAVGTGTLVTVTDASRTGLTGSNGPSWTVSTGNIQVVTLAITDGTVTPPVSSSTWW